MTEARVYIAARDWFKERGMEAMAGQPPNGCDTIQVVEIKDGINTGKGSKGSYKPDLLVGNSSYLVVVECKPGFSRSDELKLESVMDSLVRRQLLYRELNQRRIFEKRGLMDCYSDFKAFNQRLIFCLANGDSVAPRKRIFNLCLVEPLDFSRLVIPEECKNPPKIAPVVSTRPQIQ